MPCVRQRWCCVLIFSRPLNLYLPAYLYIYYLCHPPVPVNIMILCIPQKQKNLQNKKNDNSPQTLIRQSLNLCDLIVENNVSNFEYLIWQNI